MYQDISVIGVGTLGGFLSEWLAKVDSIKTLRFIDFDVVEEKNLRNSIYTKKYLGENKAESLLRIIHISKVRHDLCLTSHNLEFDEDNTDHRNLLSKSNLVVDCRDFNYDRKERVINVRMFISGRNLVVDCRKDAIYEEHEEGRYNENLTKIDIINAAFSGAYLISSGNIEKLIKKELIHTISLDYLDKITKDKLIDEEIKPDYVFDSYCGEDKFIDLRKNIPSILDMNQKSDSIVCVGDIESPTISKIVPKSSFSSSQEIIDTLLDTVNLPFSFKHYIVCINKERNQFFIQLIPETGAA